MVAAYYLEMIPSNHFCTIPMAGMAPACQEEEVRFSRAFFTNSGSASRTERPPREGLRRLIDTAEKELLFSMFRFDLHDIVSIRTGDPLRSWRWLD